MAQALQGQMMEDIMMSKKFDPERYHDVGYLDSGVARAARTTATVVGDMLADLADGPCTCGDCVPPVVTSGHQAAGFSVSFAEWRMANDEDSSLVVLDAETLHEITQRLN